MIIWHKRVLTLEVIFHWVDSAQVFRHYQLQLDLSNLPSSKAQESAYLGSHLSLGG